MKNETEQCVIKMKKKAATIRTGKSKMMEVKEQRDKKEKKQEGK